MPHISFNENLTPPIDHRTSPQPRRKQVNCTGSCLTLYTGHEYQLPSSVVLACVMYFYGTSQSSQRMLAQALILWEVPT